VVVPSMTMAGADALPRGATGAALTVARRFTARGCGSRSGNGKSADYIIDLVGMVRNKDSRGSRQQGAVCSRPGQ
jgi:hypothetical protein